MRRCWQRLGGPKTGVLGWLLAPPRRIFRLKILLAWITWFKQATNLAFHMDNLVRQFFIAIDQILI
jgi:hypothetical protein